jgi:pseudouridine kinase
MAELHSLYFYKSLCYNKIMSLTVREQQVLDLIRESPMSSPEDLARRLGISRAAVNVYVGHLTRKGALLGRGYVLPPARAGVVVVGGANMDIKAQITGEVIGATSNPGRASQAPGGVARNVAENLARLGTDTRLITAVGQDPAGDLLLERTAAAGVDVGPALLSPHCATGTYTAVLDAAGELVVAVAAMGVTDELTPEVLRARRGVLAGAGWIVADGNLAEDALTQLLALAAGNGTPVVFEPVSVPKAARLRSALLAGPVPYAVTPNLGELAALVGRNVPDERGAIAAAAAELHALGLTLVWVRRGGRGSLLSESGEGSDPIVHELPALPAQVVDVTGAGDAMLAAFLAALVGGLSPAEAARHGHAAAALTVESSHTVLPTLTPAAIRARLAAPSTDFFSSAPAHSTPLQGDLP